MESKQLFLLALVATTACSKPDSEPRKDPSTNETPSAQVPSTPLVLAPKGIHETIAGDRIKPRRERPAAIERVPRMMHRHEDVLYRVIDPGHQRTHA